MPMMGVHAQWKGFPTMSISAVHAGYTADPVVQASQVNQRHAEERTESRTKEADEKATTVTANTSSRRVDTYA
jgi:hypothetical protein